MIEGFSNWSVVSIRFGLFGLPSIRLHRCDSLDFCRLSSTSLRQMHMLLDFCFCEYWYWTLLLCTASSLPGMSHAYFRLIIGI